jgi:predicted nuclease with RNAse H fold
MVVLGIDLAGPRNHAETVAARFRGSGGELTLSAIAGGLDDGRILDLVKGLPDQRPDVIGLDAPLSYSPSGGDRPADSTLRSKLIEAGLHAGSVMAPTLTRMAYLTLRGSALRASSSPRHGIRVGPTPAELEGRESPRAGWQRPASWKCILPGP